MPAATLPDATAAAASTPRRRSRAPWRRPPAQATSAFAPAPGPIARAPPVHTAGMRGKITRLLACSPEELLTYKGMDIGPTFVHPNYRHNPINGDVSASLTTS